MSVRAQLRRVFDERLDVVMRRLAGGGSVAAVKDDLDWLDATAKVLSFGRGTWTGDALPATLVALVCVAVASVLWGTTLSRTNISLSVESDSLRGDVAKDWTLEPRIRGELVHLERVESLQAPNLGLAIESQAGDAWVRLEGSGVVLQSLRVRRGARFELSTANDATAMFIQRAPFEGRVTVVGHAHVMAGPRTGRTTVDREVEIEIPETIEFAVSASQGVASSLTIHASQSWRFGVLPLSSVGFSSETSKEPGTVALTSGLKAGQLRFNDATWEPITIRENETLSLRRIDAARSEAAVNGGTISTTVNGVVGDVVLGESEATRRVAPSYLDYFYNRQSVAFFWGCAVFLWGCLWGIRKTLFR